MYTYALRLQSYCVKLSQELILQATPSTLPFSNTRLILKSLTKLGLKIDIRFLEGTSFSTHGFL